LELRPRCVGAGKDCLCDHRRIAPEAEAGRSERGGEETERAGSGGALLELLQGTAMDDLLHPDRVLIGGRETPSGLKAVDTLASVYKQWIPAENVVTANLCAALQPPCPPNFSRHPTRTLGG